MNKNSFRIFLASIIIAAGCFGEATRAWGCTSAIALGKATKSGRPMLWKNRDTSKEDNFVIKVPGKEGEFTYVGLFNAGDSALSECWGGFNEKGFAIMNTASYNLAPDTAKFKDQEGVVMAKALKECVTVDDFEKLLRSLPKPAGIQANFGVIDSNGVGAYFEADDYTFTRFDAKDTETGVIIRTNYSFTGNETDGYGYIRYDNATHLLDSAIYTGSLQPESFLEGASLSFYHSKLGRDVMAEGDKWAIDQDFIPRRSSSAAIVIELPLPGESLDKTVMWTMLGYPPCSYVDGVMIDNVPAEMQPTEEGFKSSLCNEVVARKRKAFPIKRGSGKNYIDLSYLRGIRPELDKKSAENYLRIRALRDADTVKSPRK